MLHFELRRMGMDFYDDEDKQASDMENFRLRPVEVSYDVPTAYFQDKDGHYIAGDFQFWRANEYHPATLGWDFTDTGKARQDSVRYRGLDRLSGRVIKPTLAKIKEMLEIMTGEECEVTLEPALGVN